MPINYSDIFRSDIIADHYQRNGYAIVSLESDTLLPNLKSLHQEYLNKPVSGLYASHNENSFENNLAISDKIKSTLQIEILHHFDGVKFVLGHYMIKAQSTGDEFQLHQDWSVTDEKDSFCAHLWIPLQDTNENNGTMFVVPCSHLYFDNYRSGSLDIPRINRDELIDKMIQPLNIKEGECLVYHPALFHGSYANNDKTDRIAVLVSLIEQNDTLKYYQCSNDNSNVLEIYEISPEVILQELVDLEKGQPPKNRTPSEVMTHLQFSNNDLSSEMIYEKYSLNKNRKASEKSFFKKLFKSISIY